MAAGQAVTPTAVMRLAQIDVQLGQYDRALARLEAVRSRGKGGATAEQLAILTLEQKGDKAAARALPEEGAGTVPARRRARRAGGRAAGQGRQARRGRRRPRAIPPLRAGEPEPGHDARPDPGREPQGARPRPRAAQGHRRSLRVLRPAGPARRARARPNRLDEAAAVIDKVRARWKDSATVNILDAQVALRRGKTDQAIEHFNAALRKDPGNKIVQYWKAELDGRTGSVAEAARALEDIVRDKPVKEVDAGTTPACPRPSRPWPPSRSRPATSTTRSGDSRISSGAAARAPSRAATAGS